MRACACCAAQLAYEEADEVREELEAMGGGLPIHRCVCMLARVLQSYAASVCRKRML